MKSDSEVTQSCLTLATLWTAAYQAPPSMGFSRQEYWSGVPLPSPNVPLVSLNFLEEIPSLSHSIVFLCLFALISEEGFLISFFLLNEIKFYFFKL